MILLGFDLDDSEDIDLSGNDSAEGEEEDGEDVMFDDFDDGKYIIHVLFLARIFAYGSHQLSNISSKDDVSIDDLNAKDDGDDDDSFDDGGFDYDD